jgi:hypothetical protein
MTNIRHSELVLSLRVTAQGFGYVLFEDALSPYDWGIRKAWGRARSTRVFAAIERLIRRYEPVVLVIEDWASESCRRVPRVRKLYERIHRYARQRCIKIVCYSFAKVQEHFAYRNAITKEEIAAQIAKIIPAFSVLPARRARRGDSESGRQGLFDAAAMGLVFFAEAATGG